MTNAAVPVGGLGGDERAQRRERCVDRIGAIPLPRVGRGPLASLPNGQRHRRAVYLRHGSYVHASAQLPLPVHLDVKGRRRRGGQAVGCGVGGVGAALFGAGALAAVLLVVFGEEGDVAVQEAAGRRGRAQHGECHLKATSQSPQDFRLFSSVQCLLSEGLVLKQENLMQPLWR